MRLSFECVHGPVGGRLGGLAWDGHAMWFSDVARSEIRSFDPRTGAVELRRRYTSRSSGIAFSPDGALFACQEGSRRVVRMLPDGSAVPTSSMLDGQTHNHPHQLVVDARGRAWFSDLLSSEPASGPQIFPPLPHQSVLRLEKDERAWKVTRMTFDTVAPRGIAFSADERTLYVAETDRREHGRRELRAYPVLADGTLAAPRVLRSFNPTGDSADGVEGLCVDAEGHIVACMAGDVPGGRSGICVFGPEGNLLERHELPFVDPVACAFGDEALQALYVATLDGCLWRAPASGHVGMRRPTPADANR